MSIRKPDWHVCTGGPCVGKTTTIIEFAEAGYKTGIEPGTDYILAETAAGKTLEQICSNQRALQRAIFARGLTREKTLSEQDTMILDRGLLDPLAYCRFYGIDDSSIREEIEQSGIQYRNIFLFERLKLPIEKAGLRIENDREAKELDRLLKDVYTEAGYKPIQVPRMSVRERMDFILIHIKQ
ncbi:MAG: putative ATPase [Candidatus Peribacteria bacterium]|nr:putative ATPase [Candidatus Peribacteria bacterium]